MNYSLECVLAAPLITHSIEIEEGNVENPEKLPRPTTEELQKVVISTKK